VRAVLLALQVLAGAGDWQQDVTYRIAARLDEAAGVLTGQQELRYRNHSPDTLTSIAFHLYLNAFRPGSRWSDADSAEGRRRFNDLRDPDFGFNHVSSVRVDGAPVVPVWPFAPDSTIVRFALPRPLLPGDSVVVTMDWDARPSTLPRRQGRRGRSFDFAQWYPRVVAYDRHGWNEHPLYPAGEFYGEFGTFLVQLDVPEDQVMGATGVPLCGDPGWERARRPAGAPVTYRRDAYPSPRDPAAGAILHGAGACVSAGPGRKTVTWYAEDVHHFAISMNPEYRYEEGDVFERPVRVLYQPGDERTWGAGMAVRRTETALAWLNELFGPYPWPQITNVHRIEGSGTEFPMMVMDGDPSLALILHEVGHNYLMGLLANNEWRSGWLDEGFTSFQTTWYFETVGRRGDYKTLERQVLDWDLDRLSEPVGQPGEQFSSFAAYNAMTYDRAELFYHQLRILVGDDAMRRILREYFARYRLRHVDEEAFRGVAEEVSNRDLSVFFRQWLHETVLYDFSIGTARREQVNDSTWRTTVEVVARAEGLFPVDVAVYGQNDTAWTRTTGTSARERIQLVTRSKPRRVMLDPSARTHDWNMLNNLKTFGFVPASLLLIPPNRPIRHYPGGYFTRRTARDRLMMGWAPTAWYNDAGGWTFGLRTRDDYLGRFEQSETFVTGATGWGIDDGRHDVDVRVIIRNPVLFRAPGLSTWADVGRQEGRFRAGLGFEKTQPRLNDGPGPLAWGLSLNWINATQAKYLDPAVYDDAGTLELTAHARTGATSPGWRFGLAASSTVGMTARTPAGLTSQVFGRLTVTGTARRSLGPRFSLSGRGFAGVTLAADPLPLQRRIYLAGADPYERLDNPFLRSAGALFVRNGFQYHAPGGAGLRGLNSAVGASQAYGLTLELEGRLYQRDGGLFHRAAIAVFGDGALADGDLRQDDDTNLASVGDAGLGLRIDHRIGATSFQTRLDLPLWVSRPSLAQDRHPGEKRFGWRWTFSFSPPFGGRP
jgi:hypothetical protein